MTFFDIVLMPMLAISVFAGWKIRGSRFLVLIITLIAGIFAANYFQPQLLDKFQTHFPSVTASILAWLTPFLITTILAFFLGMILTGFFEWAPLKWMDRLLGALLACLMLLLFVAESAEIIKSAGILTSWPALEHSLLASFFLQVSQPILQTGLNVLPTLVKTLSR